MLPRSPLLPPLRSTFLAMFAMTAALVALLELFGGRPGENGVIGTALFVLMVSAFATVAMHLSDLAIAALSTRLDSRSAPSLADALSRPVARSANTRDHNPPRRRYP
jgi:hypothetical protein